MSRPVEFRPGLAGGRRGLNQGHSMFRSTLETADVMLEAELGWVVQSGWENLTIINTVFWQWNICACSLISFPLKKFLVFYVFVSVISRPSDGSCAVLSRPDVLSNDQL